MSRPASNGFTGNWGKPSGIKKRKADDELGNEQRLAKRFDLLNLGETDLLTQHVLEIELTWSTEQNGKLYVPVQRSSPARRPYTNGNHESEWMQLDDSKDKVYIKNLDDELADIESEEEKLIFLPDIEKKLGKIPKSVLLGEGHPCTGNEVVLYSVPSSLSVPEEQDKVREAIIESRARAREKQLHGVEAVAAPATHANEAEENGGLNEVENIERIAVDQATGTEDGEDAMDLG